MVQPNTDAPRGSASSLVLPPSLITTAPGSRVAMTVQATDKVFEVCIPPCSFVCRSVCAPVKDCLSVCLSVCVSVCLSVCLSRSPSLSVSVSPSPSPLFFPLPPLFLPLSFSLSLPLSFSPYIPPLMVCLFLSLMPCSFSSLSSALFILITPVDIQCFTSLLYVTGLVPVNNLWQSLRSVKSYTVLSV